MAAELRRQGRRQSKDPLPLRGRLPGGRGEPLLQLRKQEARHQGRHRPLVRGAGRKRRRAMAEVLHLREPRRADEPEHHFRPKREQGQRLPYGRLHPGGGKNGQGRRDLLDALSGRQGRRGLEEACRGRVQAEGGKASGRQAAERRELHPGGNIRDGAGQRELEGGQTGRQAAGRPHREAGHQGLPQPRGRLLLRRDRF